MACNYKNKIKKDLLDGGAVNSDSFILNLDKYKEISQKYIDYLYDSGKIIKDSKKTILTLHEKDIDPNIPKNSLFVRNNKNLKVVYDETLFEAIYQEDKLYGTVTEDPTEKLFGKDGDFGNSQNNTLDSNKPAFDSFIDYKESLIYHLEHSIQKIEDEMKNAKDSKTRSQLAYAKNVLITRLDGTGSNTGLRAELRKLKKNPIVSRIDEYSKKDFQRLEAIVANIEKKDKLVNQKSLDEITEARLIIDFYSRLGTFDVNVEHPLFPKADLFNDKGELILDQRLQDKFKEMKNKALSKKNILDEREINLVKDIVNNDKTVQKMFGHLTYEQIFNSEEGMTDASWIDSYIMDTTNGIATSNGIVPQVMMKILQDAFEKKQVFAKRIEKRIDKNQEGLTKSLTKLGYKLKIGGVNGVSYELFRTKDANGSFKDTLIQRFSDKFYKERTQMIKKINDRYQEINDSENFDYKRKEVEFRKIFRDKYKWYKTNTEVFDIRNIQEIKDDPEFQEFSKFFQNDNGVHEAKMRELLGEKGYRKELEKQKKLLRKYILTRDAMKMTLLEEEKAKFAEASDAIKLVSTAETEAAIKFEKWEIRENPFVFANSYFKKDIENTNYHNLNYTHAVPKRFFNEVGKLGEVTDVQSTTATGFYEKDFDTIENDDALMEFYDIMTEVLDTINHSLPSDVKSKLGINAIPALRKTMMDMIFDTEGTRNLSKAAAEMGNRIKQSFGSTQESNLSHTRIDPSTGKPAYIVSSQFLHTNKSQIDKLYFVQKMKLQKAMKMAGIQPNKTQTYDIDTLSQEAIEIIAENLGVAPVAEELAKRLQGEDLDNLPIYKVLKDGIVDQVVRESSFDLPKIMKLYSYLTMQYLARQETLPVITALKNHYQKIQDPESGSAGQAMKGAIKGENRFKGDRRNANSQMESWFKRVVLDNYTSKNEFIATNRGKELEKKLTIKEEKARLEPKGGLERFKMLFNLHDRKIYSAKEKYFVKEVLDLMEDLEGDINSAVSDEEKAVLQGYYNHLENIKDNVGKVVTALAFTDNVFKFARLLALAYNFSAASINFIEGQMSNFIGAASGDYFKEENIYEASSFVFENFVRVISFGHFSSKNASKVNTLMDRYRIVQDSTNELQKASAQTRFSRYTEVGPYVVNQKTEFINQSPVMIAILMDQKIKDEDGKISTVWKEMQSDGHLSEKFRTKENISNWEESDGEQYRDFKTKVTKTIVNLHGDYDEMRGNKAGALIIGKALLMFKKWMVRMIYTRFAKEQDDLELGIQGFKGRFRSHTKVSGGLTGAFIGGVSLGIPGLVVGGLVGAATASLNNVNPQLNFIRELAFICKETVINLARIPVNVIARKELWKGPNYEDVYGDLSERDRKNLKSNMMAMSINLSFVALHILTNALMGGAGDDDDDDEISFKTAARNRIVNSLMQLSSQSTMYFNPSDFWGSVTDLFVLDFFQNVFKTVGAAEKYLEGEDMILTGPNAGESKFLNQMEKTYIPSGLAHPFGIGTSTDRQFQPSVFDNIGVNDEDLAKKEARRTRSEFNLGLRKQGYNKIEREAIINVALPPRDSKESYQSTVIRYKNTILGGSSPYRAGKKYTIPASLKRKVRKKVREAEKAKNKELQ